MKMKMKMEMEMRTMDWGVDGKTGSPRVGRACVEANRRNTSSRERMATQSSIMGTGGTQTRVMPEIGTCPVQADKAREVVPCLRGAPDCGAGAEAGAEAGDGGQR